MENIEKTIHIITLNIPDPPDYGGMIDTYYRIKELNSLGIKIHLHCYVYDRMPSSNLLSLCESVHYYSRKTNDLKALLSFKPYIVYSRNSGILLQRILQDKSPVLFDGIHTTFHIKNPGLIDRIKAVRVHNIEHSYYLTLFKCETNILKKIFFFFEALKLNYYEKILLKANINFTISPGDQSYFQLKYKNAVYIPPFHPFNKVVAPTGKGTFILFHADLSVSENVKSCFWLIRNVFSKTRYSCIIAGKNPPGNLQKLAQTYSNIIVAVNPTNEQMSNYIRDAHIHVLIALKNNGLKLKLLISLFSGRFCLVNPAIVEDTILDKVCHIANTSENFLTMIDYLMNEDFTQEMIEEREAILNTEYNNHTNALKLVSTMGI